MLRKILSYGVVAGLLVGVPLSAITIGMDGETMSHYGMLIGYTMMLIALSTVFVAIKRRRDEELGGVIRFWPAFALGLGISFVASVIYVVAWEAAQAVTGSDFARGYSDMLIAQEKAKGVSGAALAKFVAEMDAFRVQYANPLWRLPMTFAEIFPVGVLVSLISAGLLRNSRFMAVRRG